MVCASPDSSGEMIQWSVVAGTWFSIGTIDIMHCFPLCDLPFPCTGFVLAWLNTIHAEGSYLFPYSISVRPYTFIPFPSYTVHSPKAPTCCAEVIPPSPNAGNTDSSSNVSVTAPRIPRVIDTWIHKKVINLFIIFVFGLVICDKDKEKD